mgnify:CR=1 FL=1
MRRVVLPLLLMFGAACAGSPPPSGGLVPVKATPSGGAPLTRAALVRAADSIAADAKFRTAHWGMLIVDPTTGDTLLSRNAGKFFMPASNQKILTGATALALLLEHRDHQRGEHVEEHCRRGVHQEQGVHVGVGLRGGAVDTGQHDLAHEPQCAREDAEQRDHGGCPGHLPDAHGAGAIP